jgi:hypothetical protein
MIDIPFGTDVVIRQLRFSSFEVLFIAKYRVTEYAAVSEYVLAPLRITAFLLLTANSSNNGWLLHSAVSVLQILWHLCEAGHPQQALARCRFYFSGLF